MMDRGATRRARDVVPHVLKAFERHAGGPRARLQAEWAEIVGPHLGHRTRPTWVRGRRLTVEVDDPILATELARYWRDMVLEAIAKRLGPDAIKDIVFRYAAFDDERGGPPP